MHCQSDVLGTWITSQQVDCYFQKTWTHQYEPKCVWYRIFRLTIRTQYRSIWTNVGLSGPYLLSWQVDCYPLKTWTDRNETKCVRKIMVWLMMISTKPRSIWFRKKKLHLWQISTPSTTLHAQKNRGVLFALTAGWIIGFVRLILFIYTHGTKTSVLSLLNRP